MVEKKEITYQTKVIRIDRNLLKSINESTEVNAPEFKLLREERAIQQAAELLREGEVVAFPTETVYGLGADATNSEAVQKIFKAKGRPQDNPLIVHIALEDQLNKVVKGCLNETSRKLIKAFWPGPLTIIAEKGGLIPPQTTAGLDSVAIRMPAHPVARAIIMEAGCPVAAPSANLSGTPSPTTAAHVFDDLQGRIPLIVDGGQARIGIESTVVDTRAELPVILRPGGISQEDIEKVLGHKLGVALPERGKNNRPLSPGMKYRHYSPETPLILVNSIEELLKKINEYGGFNLGVVVTAETRKELGSLPEGVQVISMGSVQEPAGIAARIFAILRQLDSPEYDYIIIEAIPEKGLGSAVMNRLLKASLKE